MTSYTCDRCGRDIELNNYTLTATWAGGLKPKYDLCPKCFRLFVKKVKRFMQRAS